MQGSNSIKPQQLALIIFIAQTGIGILMLPTELSRTAGHDGWISLLLTGMLSVILGGFILALMHRYRDKNIYDINRLLFGKVIGMGLNTLLLVYLLAAVMVGFSNFTYFIRVTLLPETPVWVLSPFIVLPSLYLVWQGLKDMSRFLYISALNYIIITFLPLLLIKEFRWSFLMPVGEAGVSGILKGMEPAFFSFIGLELLSFFHPYVTDRKKESRWYIGAIFMSLVLFVSYVLISTSIFGEDYLKILALPFYNLARLYRAPIIERLDLYITALWYIPLACSLRNYVFACFDGIQKVYGLKKTKVLYIAYFLLIEILSGIPNSINAMKAMTGMVNLAGMVVCGFLLLCLLLSFVRRKGVVQS